MDRRETPTLKRPSRKRPKKRQFRRLHHEDITVQKGFERIAAFEEDEPFDFLGPHVLKEEKCLVVRTFLPRAKEAWIKPLGSDHKKTKMERIHPAGIYQAMFEQEDNHLPYRVAFLDAAGTKDEAEDPYAFGHRISDLDLQLLGEGNFLKSYEKLGAIPMTLNGVPGVHFALWAPNAKSASVVGDFNHWRPGTHPMQRVHFSGVWALFIPRLGKGDLYKFAVRGSDGEIRVKADPHGYEAELRPRTANKVASLEGFVWRDAKWLKSRREWNYLRSPISIYEVHLGSWKRSEKNGWGFLTYRGLAHDLVKYAKEMGYTHIELLPVAEHPLDESWGYQIINYFAPTSRFGSPEDFMYFVDHCHRNGIGVIIDWVPAHFPRDAHGLGHFDGREIYAYESWKKREHRDWGTFVFDYGRNEVRNFLISNALFWLDKYHVDGLRVDAVASMLYLDYSREAGEWEPNAFGGNENLEAIDFLKKFNEIVHREHPGVLTIAEESTAWPGVSKPTYLGGLGFSLKWNMGWMHDSLYYFSRDAVYRKWHQGTLTFSMLYAFTENFVLPISHDEVVHGKGSLVEKMPGDDWQKFANLRLFLAYLFTHPGKKLLFMGSDFAQRREWNCIQSLDWDVVGYDDHKAIQQAVKDLNRLYREHKALYELDFESGGFEWIDFSDADASIISFVRRSCCPKEFFVVVCNMTPVARLGYRVGVPEAGFYREVFNSDAVEYGGSGIGNFGGFHSDPVYQHGRPHSLNLNLPPLGAVLLRFEHDTNE